jgi:hemolysin D
MNSANQKIVAFPKLPKPKVTRGAHEIAFLPAELEITETPPSPIGRAIGATLVAVFLIALTWAAIGDVDIVAAASGKIVPSGRTKLIQPLETGVVSAIHVHDGQKVKAGEVLIELDPTMTSAEQEHLNGDLMGAQLDVARLRAALAWRMGAAADPIEAFQPPSGASGLQIETQRQFLISQTSEQSAKLSELERELAQKEAERATVVASTAKLEATVPVLQERVDVRKILFDKALGSKLTYLTEYQDLVAMKQDIAVNQSRLHESDAAVAALRETRQRTEAEYRRSLFSELTKAEQLAAGFAHDVVRAERRTKLQRLTAPVDGVVQQLAIHTVGGVVTPAQALAVVVPDNTAIEIEAMLPNRDVGFVHAGQDASIKVDTFNFTRYGLLRGSVLSVSQDAVSPSSSQGKQNPTAEGAPPGADDGKAESLQYVARISLGQTQMNIDGKPVNLTPGMAVTVEIKTGARRIISYLLSPLEKNRQESLRER